VSVTDGKFKYVYNYTDHLGNIRLSYSRPELTSPVGDHGGEPLLSVWDEAQQLCG
ncbi:hypothetical protein J2X31_002918, partial [Flavobacterium arsenatis]|nr:hypothetical protein [Flavobacterium arsenatis]